MCQPVARCPLPDALGAGSRRGDNPGRIRCCPLGIATMSAEQLGASCTTDEVELLEIELMEIEVYTAVLAPSETFG